MTRDDRPQARGTGPSPPTDDERARRGAAALAGAGLEFAAGIILFVLGGQWLDRRLGTDPTFLMVGLLIGFGGGFFRLYRRMTAMQRREEEERRK